MRSRLRRWRRLGGPFQADTAVPTASQSFLIPRFPGLIDEKPDFEDGTTFLTSLYLDFLQLVVESVQATIGPLDENQNNQIFGYTDFRDFLDQHSLGLPANAGKIAGIFRVVRSATVHATEGWKRFSHALNVGRHTGTVPVFLGTMNQQHTGTSRVHSTSDFINGAASVRGDVQWTSVDGDLVLDLQAIQLTGSGTPTQPAGNDVFIMTGFILFLKVAKSW